MEFQKIYDTMRGLLEEWARVPWVDNAFEEGSRCACAYEDMRSAYERLCERLGVCDEDQDLDIIVDSMEAIQEELCERMYMLSFQEAQENLFFKWAISPEHLDQLYVSAKRKLLYILNPPHRNR